MNNKAFTIALVVLVIFIIGGIGYYLYQNNNQRGSFTIGQDDDWTTFMELKPNDLEPDKYEIYLKSVETLKENPTEKAATLNLGYRYREAGYYDEAAKAFNQHLKADPYDPEALLGLARIQVNKGQYREAEQSFYDIVEVFPNYMMAYKELLPLYQENKIPLNRKFIEELNDALEFDEEGEYEQEIRQLLLDYNSIQE